MALDITRKTPESVSHTIISGTAYDGTTAIPVIAQAPGYLPSPWGSDEMVSERLVLEDQLYANMIAGRVIANANREIVDVSVPLAGNWLPALDIAPQNWVQMNVQAADNKRGISLEGYYHLRNITSEIKVVGGSSLADITLIPEAFGPDGVPGPYPDDYPWPTFPLPPLPEFPPWAFPRWDTLMVRNCFSLPADWYEKIPYYQRTVINDPSSILPANSGAETMNVLYSSNSIRQPEMVTDGIMIYFHQYDWTFPPPPDYRNRIYRHDIATGAVDYLELPNETMEDGTLTCIDIGVVAVIIWDDDDSYDTARLCKVDFNTGVVEVVYSYNNPDINPEIRFCATMQSTLNVYTVFDVQIMDNAVTFNVETIEFHRYNWTTGVSTVTTVWENPMLDYIGDVILYCPPVIVDNEIYAFYTNLYVVAPANTNWQTSIIHYNYSLATFGEVIVYNLSGDEPSLLKAAPYYDLKRIYFQAEENFGADGHIYYLSTLDKELTYVDNIQIHYVTHIANKSKCWRMDWSYGTGHSKVINPFTGEEKWLGIGDSGEDSLWPMRNRLAWCVDDLDDTIYTYLGNYIIGNRLEDTQINETGITNYPDNYHWIYLMGRTFVIVKRAVSPRYEAWVVSYPGSIVT